MAHPRLEADRRAPVDLPRLLAVLVARPGDGLVLEAERAQTTAQLLQRQAGLRQAHLAHVVMERWDVEVEPTVRALDRGVALPRRLRALLVVLKTELHDYALHAESADPLARFVARPGVVLL